MGRQRRPSALVLVAFLPLLLAPTTAAAESSDACVGDFAACTGRAEGVATGDGFELGLYVPGENGRARDVSGGASSCPGCRWEIVPACEDNTPGTGDNDVSCARAAFECASTGGTLVAVYLKRPGE
ncbi:MAG TPA: hypothetical protein VNA14_00765, partial [Mycobacteriales bacterium]|nr:hypothetical protein [Mycobacteriales bacterium]